MFMTENIEDQKTWINAKMNLARASTNKETRRREEEIIDRIIPTGILDLDEDFDEEKTDNLSECQTYDPTLDQEEYFVWKDYQVYSSSLPEQEKSDEFIDKDTEEEDIQPLESLKVSYQNHKKQDEETIHSLPSEFDDQLIGAKYFTEPDKCWGYDNKHIKDEDKWEMAKTNQMLFKPTVIFSSPYSPMIPQTKMDEIFQNQKSEYQTIETKEEQDTEYTRQTRDGDLFSEPEECTSWTTRTEYKWLLNPENQPQIELMKLNGIDVWPTPTMTTEVKSFLGFINFDTEFTLHNEDSMKPQNKRNKKEQDNRDIIALPEELFLRLSSHGFSNELTFEKDNEQFDPIKTLSVHKPKRLHNHFSKVTATTSVNDEMTVNIKKRDLQRQNTKRYDRDKFQKKKPTN